MECLQAPLRTPSSPDRSRLIPFVLDCTRLSPTGACSQANENGDLSFLLYFSKQCLVEKIHGKFKKNSSVTFISEESP